MAKRKKKHGAEIALQATRKCGRKKKKKNSTPTRAAGAGSSMCKGDTRTVTARRRAARGVTDTAATTGDGGSSRS